MATTTSEPAYPCAMAPDWPECDRGMTLRDYFAGQALVEFASLVTVSKPETLNVVARLSYQMADAMLTARQP